MFKGRRGNLHWGDINMAELELDKLVLHFEQSNRAEGKSPKTVSWYEEMLSVFTRHLEKVLEEYEVLEPFKAFLNVPCEICHEPITEWGDYSVKLAIQGIGCGHTQCWNSELGRLIELRKAIEKVKKT